MLRTNITLRKRVVVPFWNFLRTCKDKPSLPFTLSSDHNIQLREGLVNFQDDESDSDDHIFNKDLMEGDMEYGDCNPDAGELEFEEEDDKSHPVEDTGFEFRRYEADSNLELESEGEMEQSNVSPEEEEMLQLPEQKERTKKVYPYIARDFTKCRGCGIRLQSKLPLGLGYVPPPNVKKSRKKRRVCQRCYYLRYYNKEPPQIEKNIQLKYETGLSAEAVSGYLSEVLPSKSCVVLHIVDLSDPSPDAFIPNLNKVVGTNPVLFIGTKLDLLPHGWSIQRLKIWLQQYAKEHCGLNQLPLTHVHVVSSRSLQNVKPTMKNIDLFRKGRDLYVIGPVNCGKSSFINSALLHVGIGGIKYDKKYGLTTSNLPGTTLDAISMPLKSGGHLHDTPGFSIPNVLPSLVTKERKLVISRKAIRPRLYFMREGKTLLLGGLARLDYLRGPPLYFAVCGSSTLNIHATNFERADEMFEEKLGDFLQPPILLTPEELKKETEQAEAYTEKMYKYLIRDGEPAVAPSADPEAQNIDDQLLSESSGSESDTAETEYENNELAKESHEEIPFSPSGDEATQRKTRIELLNEQRPIPLPSEMKEEIFTFDEAGEDYDSAFVDFVFPGIGWISATGKSNEKLVFRASSFSKPLIREPIMPLEADRIHRKKRGYKKHGKLSNYIYQGPYKE